MLNVRVLRVQCYWFPPFPDRPTAANVVLASAAGSVRQNTCDEMLTHPLGHIFSAAGSVRTQNDAF